ncbi:MAG: T9SS type A sorting domain-containing protein [Saprospiraceae bacterium]|nr:aryl-sulfate sulfotransferase [Bacteroidia bacterium]NNE16235.1 T9SS type A sorting domain-containing protein [Saprospiraceae bacterium]NNL91203.1 T9SS type A sorting domain-containing protein [Saprospiraceae bacterium]
MKIRHLLTHFICLLAVLFFTTSNIFGQNTVGLLSYDQAQSYQGYTLFYPHNQPNVYLINNCGELVHVWVDDADFRPGNTAYLRPDGSLVKAKRNSSVAGDNIWAGGGGAIVDIVSWDNELLWSYELNNDSLRLHHDIAPMPNGNILMIAWELKSNEEAIAMGRDPETLNQVVLWPDFIFEINPETDEIVWEWHVWDHLIQDFDSTKANYGVISEHNELVDINYDTNDGKSDWMHSNALDYNPELDQIMLSVPTFSELWVIDHSTTTEQAASHFGGNVNHGGDLIYRFGNPQTYDKGDSTDQLLFYQHDTHWTNEFLPPNHPMKGNIVCFNNRLPGYSAVEIFPSSWEMYINDYEEFQGSFPPFELENTITHPDTFSFYSTGLSSAQLLPNGNMLMCSGRQGYMVELTPSNEIVWEYKTPIRAGFFVSQGEELELNNNLTFRAFRYPPDYAAFDGRNLEPQGVLELDAADNQCERVVPNINLEEVSLGFFPNPTSGNLHLTWDNGKIVRIDVYDLLGRQHISTTGNGGMKYLDVSHLEPNIYIVNIEGVGSGRFIVE